MTESFRGSELQIEDLVGACMLVEGSAAFVAGGSVTAMLLGIPPVKLQDEVASGLVQIGVGVSGGQLTHDAMQRMGVFESSANAVLVMGGMTAGANVGAGVLGSIGYLWHGEGRPVDMNLQMPPLDYKTTIPYRIRSQESGPPIVLPGDTLFDFDKFNIKPSAEQSLNRAGFLINVIPGRRVLIYGYTDSIGSPGYNQTLSEKRAAAVKQWLVSRDYLKESQATASGFGESDPVASNDDPDGRAKNRRVEIVMLKP
jgi:outer membrane protein OmpA-like peptidoglycan-associated protein